MSVSEIEAKEPHQPTVMLTIHPHLVNEHPPTLPTSLLSCPHPHFLHLLSSPLSISLSDSLALSFLAVFVCFSDSHASISLSSTLVDFPSPRPHSANPPRNANYGNMKSLG